VEIFLKLNWSSNESIHYCLKACVYYYYLNVYVIASVVQWSEFLAIDAEVRVPFPALPDFLRSSAASTGSTQPREYN
jgi:hypothetical protein